MTLDFAYVLKRLNISQDADGTPWLLTSEDGGFSQVLKVPGDPPEKWMVWEGRPYDSLTPEEIDAAITQIRAARSEPSPSEDPSPAQP